YQNGARAFVAGGLFLMLVLGRGFVFCLAAWLGWLRAPDDRPAAQHSTKQKARTMAGFFEFGCGDRI
ncbi:MULTISPECIES: hypothetical protein, partial [Mesorhizobium]